MKSTGKAAPAMALLMAVAMTLAMTACASPRNESNATEPAGIATASQSVQEQQEPSEGEAATEGFVVVSDDEMPDPEEAPAQEAYPYTLIAGGLQADSEELPQAGHVLSTYGGATLIGFETEREMEGARQAYSELAEYVASNEVFEIAAGNGSGEYSATYQADVFQTAANAASTPVDESLETTKGELVALIDTGVDETADVAGSVNLLGGDDRDENGHGTLMFERIREENDAARVFSIKALDSQGRGTVSSVYAAIVYAADSGASIINMSFAAYAPNGNEAVQDAVAYAKAQGCQVVAAAGNKNDLAEKYIPAGMSGVITVGALTKTGDKQPLSNYGDAVNAWIESESTSEAAARMSGWMSMGNEPSEYAGSHKASDDATNENGGESDAEQPEPEQDTVKDVNRAYANMLVPEWFKNSEYFIPQLVGTHITHTVRFDAAGGEGTMSDLAIETWYGVFHETALPECTFTRDGFEFAGWVTDEPDELANLAPLKVPDKQSLLNLSFMAGEGQDERRASLVDYERDGVVTLHATWRATDGTVTGADKATDTGCPVLFEAATSSTTYTALYHWRSSSTGDDFLTVGSQSAPSGFSGKTQMGYMPTSSATPVYAIRWVDGDKRLDFGVVNLDTRYLFTYEAKEVNDQVATGYYASMGTRFYSDDAKGIQVHRYAGGTFHKGLPTTDLADEFWHRYGTTHQGGIEEVSVMYMLKWYNVNYTGNGATSGSTASQRMQWGISYALNANGFSRTGYTFAGWSGSNGKSYSNKQSVSNLVSTANGSMTMTAKWSPITYKISYAGMNGASFGASHPTSATYDKAFTVSAPTKVNHRFNGWTITGMDGVTHTIGGTTTKATSFGPTFDSSFKNLNSSSNATVTFTANWVPETYISYYVDGNTTPWKKETYDNWGDPFAIADATTEGARKNDCHHLDGTQGFDGWYIDPDFTQKYEPSKLPLGPYNLYARNWTSVKYENGGDSDPTTIYTAKNGTTGTIEVASVTPDDFEVPYSTTSNLGDIANDRLTYGSGAAFPSTIRAKPAWYREDDDTQPSITMLRVTSDAVVYKYWIASTYDGYVGDRN